LILIIYPGALWDASFQLTFAAVFSILYLVPGLRAYFEKEEDDETASVVWRRRFAEKPRLIFLVTVAAIVGTAPALAYHFHRVSIAGFVTNFFSIPLVGFVALPLGLLSAFVLPLWEGFSLLMLNVSDATIGATVRALRFFASLPGSSVWVSRPTVFEIMLFYMLIVCLKEIKKRRVAMYVVPAIILALFADLGYWHLRGLWDRDLRVSFISVGQGDSALVEFPPDGWGRRKTMLIDGGDIYRSGFDTGEMVVAPFLWTNRIKKIDYIVLSHPQKDHMGGLEFIAGAFSIFEFWWNGEGAEGGEGGKWVAAEGGYRGLGGLGKALDTSGAEVLIVNGATEKRVINGVEVEFLHPLGNNPPLDTNNNSLVIRLSYGTRSFLFTGDIGAVAEELIATRDMRADVLKVPHHGSRASSSGAFLDAVSPEVAVVSAGWKNVFGLPHGETLERYSTRGISLLRTDINGAVTIETDGYELRLTTHLTGEGA
jgi:competence protein ComEC